LWESAAADRDDRGWKPLPQKKERGCTMVWHKAQQVDCYKVIKDTLP